MVTSIAPASPLLTLCPACIGERYLPRPNGQGYEECPNCAGFGVLCRDAVAYVDRPFARTVGVSTK